MYKLINNKKPHVFKPRDLSINIYAKYLNKERKKID